MVQSALQKKHFYWLDTIRFISALIVLFTHSRNFFFLPWSELPLEDRSSLTFVFYLLGRLGHEAVIVFFVLSGFLVGGVGLERIFSKTFNISSYIVDRAVRILLPLITAIILYVLIRLMLGDPICLITIIGNLFSLQGVCVESLVDPFWSLSYEVWFYVFIAALGIIISKRIYKQKFCGIIIFFIVIVIFVSGLKAHYLLIWLLGAVTYLSRPKKFNKWIFILSIIGFFFSVACWQISSNSDSLSFAYKLENKGLIEVIMSLFFCLFIQHVILVRPTNKLSLFIESCVGKLACFSYTLYLCHMIIFIPIFRYIYDFRTYDISFINIIKWISVVLITMTCSYLIYLVTEKHTDSVKSLLKQKCNIT